MTDNETKVELQYIVWQYLQKESPSIAAKFKKQKRIKPREEADVSLFNLYDLYKRNKSDAVKRESESEIEESPVNKKARLCQEENNVEDGLVKVSEKDVNMKQRNEENNSLNQEKSNVKTQDDKLDEKSQEDDDKSDAKSQEGDKSDETLSLNEIHENSDKATEQNDDGKAIVSESNIPSEDSSVTKPAAEPESSNEKKKTLLPKPEKKKTLLCTPFSSIHKNDPNFYNVEDRRKTLLPEPSSPVPAVGPPGRKTLLAEPVPVCNSGRKPLLPEPLPLPPQYKRAIMPLLMESLPPPPQSVLQEKRSRVDRMDLLAEPPPVDPLYSSMKERSAFLSHSLEPDQSAPMRRSERRSLLGGPPEHYHDSQERKELPSLLNVGDASGKRRALSSNQSPLLRQRERMQRSADHTELSNYQLYCKGEAGPSSKPLGFNEKCEYDDSSQLYFRRAQTKEPESEIPLWEDEEAVLVAKLKEYLKRLSRCSKKFSAITERFGLVDKPTNPPDLEVHKRPSIPHPSCSNPDSYACYMREKNVSMARRDQMLPERSGRFEKLMADKLGAGLIKRGTVNRNEARVRKYEEELKSIGMNMTSEMSNAFRRGTENKFASPDQEMRQRLYERYDQKMGFL